MPFFDGYAVVFGGDGAIGSSCISLFKANNWWVGCINLWKATQSKDIIGQESIKSTYSMINPFNANCNEASPSKLANLNYTIQPDRDICEQEEEILEKISKALERKKLDAVICLAGDFTAGNAQQQLSAKMDLMWKQNVWPSILAASIAVTHMQQSGFLCLSGARSALNGTPGMIGYGVAKAAIHQLTKSLAAEGSALPVNTTCIALLPLTLDTVINKQATPQDDISSWTPTKYITDQLFKWSSKIPDRPLNGSLVQFITNNFNTNVSIID